MSTSFISIHLLTYPLLSWIDRNQNCQSLRGWEGFSFILSVFVSCLCFGRQVRSLFSSYIFFCDKLVINIPGCFVVLLTLTSVLPALLNKSAVFGLQHWPFLKKRVTFMLCSVRDQFMKSVGFKGNEKCNMLLAKMFKPRHFSRLQFR